MYVTVNSNVTGTRMMATQTLLLRQNVANLLITGMQMESYIFDYNHPTVNGNVRFVR